MDDQYGKASRWGPHIVNVAVLNVRRDTINPTVEMLLAEARLDSTHAG